MTVTEYNSAIDEYADNIFRFALKQLRNEMSAKDIVQETFTKVWIKHEEIQFEKVKSYLFTTAHRLMIDWRKSEKKNGEFESNSHSFPANETDPFDLQEILTEALNKLPEIQKTVILLRDYEGYSYSEIAEITNLSESQVKVYIFRGRKTVQEFVKRLDLVL